MSNFPGFAAGQGSSLRAGSDADAALEGGRAAIERPRPACCAIPPVRYRYTQTSHSDISDGNHAIVGSFWANTAHFDP